MCGIVGITRKEEISADVVLKLLKRMEYRGYDSFGIANNNSDSKNCHKYIGEIANADVEGVHTVVSNSKTFIAHTRWATHGGVTEQNAHPHIDCNNELFIVHNGIIDNYLELKNELQEKRRLLGKVEHDFKSQTDSEVIAHFFEDNLAEGREVKDTVETFFRKAKGEFAIVVMRKNDATIYAFKRGSPLVLGINNEHNEHIVASDIQAFSDRTSRAIFFNENEYAEIQSNNYKFFRYDEAENLLKECSKTPNFVTWRSDDITQSGYAHHMLKEIKDEPNVARMLLTALNANDGNATFHEQRSDLAELAKLVVESKRVVFVASGSSYHAGLLGAYFLGKVGIEAHAIIASEFRNFTLLDGETLVIAVTQSGETMDVISALRGIKQEGVKIASFVNVPYSTVKRMSQISINIYAGQEISVAATKTFINQIIAIISLAGKILDVQKKDPEIKKKLEQKLSLDDIAQLIDEITTDLPVNRIEEQVKKVAKKLKDSEDIYIIGRGFCYPVALEMSLKLKEVAYIHAEGMMAGELKHGTLALIEDGTPVIALIPSSNLEVLSNVKEVQARGARIIALSDIETEYETICIPRIPLGNEVQFAILTSVIGQLLTYYIAAERKDSKGKDLSIDKPRNLAKSVTVK